jgi:PKD repeat protein
VPDETLDIVITEVMYNPPSGDSDEDYIELHNKSATNTYNLENWRFTQGIAFTFPDIDMGPGDYLVICGSEASVQRAYGITNTVGDWDTETALNNGGERIRLESDDDIEVEDFTFDDRAPWPILADGLGHSLERRRVDFDNDHPANWGASQSSPGWTRYTVNGLATSSSLYIYLGEAGTAYIDDVALFPLGNPGDNRVENSGFEIPEALEDSSTGTGWRARGTHSGSVITTSEARSGSRSCRIVSTGRGSSNSTSVSQIDLGLTDGEQYTLEFWALLPDPGQSLTARLSGSGGEATPIRIEVGGGGSTPGRENSVHTNNLPPFVYPIVISPETPTSRDDVTILATLFDDSGIGEVTAFWDDGGGVEAAEMFDDGNHNDGAARDGIYGVEIGSFSTGTIVRYWVLAEDDNGSQGRFPFFGSPTPNLGFYIEPTGISPTFPLRSNSGLESENPPVYHMLISTGQLTGNPPHLSGDLRSYRPATFIHNGEVFDNIRVRHRGQSSLGRPKKHWKFDFLKDNRFRTPFVGHPEVDNINLQGSEGDKSFLREYLSYKLFMDVGEPGLEMWHVRFYINGTYRGLYVHLENPNSDWCDREPGLDDEGWLWKSYSQARSSSTGGFEIKADAGQASQANSALSAFLGSMNGLTGTNLVNYINANMNVDSFVNFLACHQVIHNADHPAKNYMAYADEDAPAGTWTYLLWDADLTHGRNYECSNCGLGGGVWNDCMRYDFWGGQHLLFGTSVRPKCDGPWNGVINGFLQRTTEFREDVYLRTAQVLDEFYHPDVIHPIIDDLAGPLASEVALDWSRNRPTYGRRNAATTTDYLFHVNELKSWAENRYDFLSDALSDLQAPGIDNIACDRDGDDVTLTWDNRSNEYDSIRVYRNGGLVRTLSANAESVVVALDLDVTINSFRVASVYGGVTRPGESCSVISETGGFVKVINENFSSTVPISELTKNCATVQRSGRLELTPPNGSQAGSAFFRQRVPIDNFIVDFDLRFDDPSATGADGMAFIINTGSSSTLTQCGASGGAMGYRTGDAGLPAFPGYGIVFDTWQNGGEPSHNWCGFYRSTSTTASRSADVPEEFNGNGTFHVRVVGEDGRFTVLMSNSEIDMVEREIFNYTVPGFAAGQEAYFGFSAGTGGAVARHSVDNVCVQISTDVPDAPRAGFSANVTSGTAPLVVRFTDSSTGDVDSRSWRFGDGDSSTSTNPRHTYDAPGRYTVSLTVEGPGGDDTLTRTNYIDVMATEVNAEFTASPTLGVAPVTVSFTNTSTGASSYRWDFGDGRSSTARNPSHTYAEGGSFTVTLTAAGPGDEEDVLTRKNYIRVDGELVADFEAIPTSGGSPLLVTFLARISGGSFDAVLWDFGDGNTSNALNPVHTYQADGLYTVRLQVFGFASIANEVKTDYIRVGDVGGGEFIRGDANNDGQVDLSDGVAILNELFLGVPSAAPCKDALDSNDDGGTDLSDGVYVLNFLFQGGNAPPAPYPNPGSDSTPDALPDCI